MCQQVVTKKQRRRPRNLIIGALTIEGIGSSDNPSPRILTHSCWRLFREGRIMELYFVPEVTGEKVNM